MAQTVIRGTQILNNTVQRQDLDTSTVGQAVVTKLVQGSGISLSSTGADAGTGDVTVSSPDVVSTDAGNIATLGTDNHILVPQSQIWSATRRVFNSIGNPTFEIDQRNAGTQSVNPGSGVWAQDRWQNVRAGFTTFTYNIGQGGYLSGLVVPGTSFRPSNNTLFVASSAQQASLAAGDVAMLVQYVEGPLLRELIGDVHSVSILAYTNVTGGLKFAFSLRDPASAHSLVKLCTIPASTWTLVTLPNIPVFSASGNFSLTPGNLGYTLGICFAAGSTYIAPANDTWQNGNFVGAIGMDNLGAKPVGSQLFLGFIQHEPGALCTTPIDKPFTQNYDECLRYYQKSYAYLVAVGIGSTQNSFATFNSILAVNNTAFALYGGVRFPKPLARAPTTSVAYHPNTGAANQALLYYASSGTVPNTSTPQAVSSVVASAGAVVALNCPTGTSTAPMTALAEWMVDTGW